MSKNIEKIDAVAKPGGTTSDGKAYARLEYYMVDHPGQKEWRKIPGFVVAADQASALEKAKAIANQLDGLTLRELPAAYRALFADGNSALQKRLQ